MIDLTFDRKSTSEGQSYGLFFALVADQRTQFDTLLKWTSDNLASAGRSGRTGRGIGRRAAGETMVGGNLG